MALAYKLLENNTGIEMDEEGRPIVIDDTDDKTFGLDAIHLYSKIPVLQEESKKHREEKQKLQKMLEPFGDKNPTEILDRVTAFGDIDPDDAKAALQTVANLEDLDKNKNIEIEKVQAKITANYEEKMKNIDLAHANELKAVNSVVTQKDNLIHNLTIRGAFDRSKFIPERTFLTPDIAYNSFGKYFQIEEDGDSVKVYALDRSGEKIFSKANPAEYAPPEEAIELIINAYPQKDDILRAKSGGSGATGNRGTRGKKDFDAEAFQKLSSTEKMLLIRKEIK